MGFGEWFHRPAVRAGGGRPTEQNEQGGPAGAAQLIDRNATGVKIVANAKGEGLLTYSAGGKLKHVLLWGAVDAKVPTQGAKQEKFKVDYAGGWGKYHTVYWKTFANTCG